MNKNIFKYRKNFKTKYSDIYLTVEGTPTGNFEYNNKIGEIFNIYINDKQTATDPVQITSFFKTFFSQINEESFLLYIQMFDTSDKTSINYIDGQLFEYSHTFKFDKNKNGKILYEKDKSLGITFEEDSDIVNSYLMCESLNKILNQEMKRLGELKSLSSSTNKDNKEKSRRIVKK